MLAAVGARNLLFLDEFHHLFISPAVSSLAGCILNALVGPEPLLTVLTVHQRVRKTANIDRCHPSLGVHEDRRVQAYIIGTFLNEFLPPCTLYIVLELHAQRAVIPGICQSAVDLGARVYKSPAFAEGNDLIHSFFGIFHVYQPFPIRPDRRILYILFPPPCDRGIRVQTITLYYNIILSEIQALFHSSKKIHFCHHFVRFPA